jgi:hypothetical protein
MIVARHDLGSDVVAGLGSGLNRPRPVILNMGLIEIQRQAKAG